MFLLEGLGKSLCKGLALPCPIRDGGVCLPSPWVRKVNNEPGSWRATRHREDIMQHRVLLIALVRLAKCMSERPVEVEHTRCFHQHGQLPYQGKRNRCHPACFNFTCEQSHGPRTDRSGGDQDHQIDPRLGKQFPNLASECKE